MILIFKCESVRGVTDAVDRKVGEAVCLRALPGAAENAELGDKALTASLNITIEQQEAFGSFERGRVYRLEITPQG